MAGRPTPPASVSGEGARPSPSTWSLEHPQHRSPPASTNRSHPTRSTWWPRSTVRACGSVPTRGAQPATSRSTPTCSVAAPGTLRMASMSPARSTASKRPVPAGVLRLPTTNSADNGPAAGLAVIVGGGVTGALGDVTYRPGLAARAVALANTVTRAGSGPADHRQGHRGSQGQGLHRPDVEARGSPLDSRGEHAPPILQPADTPREPAEPRQLADRPALLAALTPPRAPGGAVAR
jgi:hypothetical protein